ncbi:MAG: hypothetical protein ACTSY1_05565 [Alphaproteobacteria bacterium]
MKYRLALLALAGFGFLGWPGAVTPALAFCVENQDEARVFFVTEPADGSGMRRAFWLNMGEKVCDKPEKGNAKVYVRVFASDEDLEGCSKIIAANKSVRLDKLELYDRCAWTVMMRS